MFSVGQNKAVEKPKISSMEKMWDLSCKVKQYDILKTYLKECEQQGRTVEEFFAKKGRLILSLAVRKAHTGELEFICVNVSHYLVQDILRENPYILEGFLGGQNSLDNHYESTQRGLDVRMKKLELLLKMGVKNLLEEALSRIKQPQSERLLSDFKVAVETWEKEQVAEKSQGYYL